MMWLTWRQHRLQAAIGAAVLALLGLFLVISRRDMTGYMQSTGLADCLSRGGSCDSLMQLFENRYGTLLNDVAYFNFLPLFIGVFWGAPLLAREYEQGTEVLAWSQTVSRLRWLAVKLGAFVVLAAAFATLFSILFSWWFEPFARLAVHGGQSRIQPYVFDVQGIVPIGYVLFAFALGAAAGAFLRRTLPAMALTAGVFVAARFAVQEMRAHFLPPLRVILPFVGPHGSVSFGAPLVSVQNWVIQFATIDSSNRIVPDQTVFRTCNVGFHPKGAAQCITAHGFRQLDLYQPASRYWPLQGIEFGIFAGLAIILLFATVYAVTLRQHVGWSRDRSPRPAQLIAVPPAPTAADQEGFRSSPSSSQAPVSLRVSGGSRLAKPSHATPAGRP